MPAKQKQKQQSKQPVNKNSKPNNKPNGKKQGNKARSASEGDKPKRPEMPANIKNRPTIKRNRPEYDQKFIDEFKDYFPRGGEATSKKNKNEEDEDFMFNKAPILVSKQKDSALQENFKKQARKQFLKDKKKKLMDVIDSDDEFFGYNTSKRQQMEADLFEDATGGETFFNSMKHDFTSFFMLNKNQQTNMTKIPQIKMVEGTMILAAVCDKGPNGKYMEVNLGRNQKAYISHIDMSESNNEGCVKSYKIGEYVVGMVIPGMSQKNVQLTVKASKINSGLNFEDIFVGMTLCGSVESEEDTGFKINFFTQDRCIGFLKTDESNRDSEGADCSILSGGDKCHLFTVAKKDEKKKLLHVTVFNAKASAKLNNNNNDDEAFIMGLDLSNAVKPGNLANCVVQKVLENGVLVKFQKIFQGFIFEDHLTQPLENYQVKQKFQARIIATDLQNKQINLSQKPEHLSLSVFDPLSAGFRVGEVFDQGFSVVKCLYGKSYLVAAAKKNQSEENAVVAFLHKQHVDEHLLSKKEKKSIQQQPSEEGEKKNSSNKEVSLKEGMVIQNKKLMIKEINYFEHYPIVTSLQNQIADSGSKSNGVYWPNLEAGQSYKGTVVNINLQQQKVFVQLSEHVKGVVDFAHLSDQLQQTNVKMYQVPPTVKEGRKVNVRVLSVDSEQKQLKLTMKPSLLEAENVLFNYEDTQIGTAYQGVIVKSLDYGFLVTFFNNITGLLTFKDLEEVNKENRNQFKVGQTIEVYASFVNAAEKKVGLSYSNKGVSTHSMANQSQKKIAKVLDNLKHASETDPEFFGNSNESVNLDEIAIGSTFEYLVDKKHSESSEFLVLKFKSEQQQQSNKKNKKQQQQQQDENQKSHKAIVLKQHVSDFAEHYDAMFDFYLNNQSNPKVKGVVIGKLSNSGYVLVSLKPSLVANQLKKTTFAQLKKGDTLVGYADFQTSKGVVVKINNDLSGFAQFETSADQKQQQHKPTINVGDTLVVQVRKVEPSGEKLYFSILKSLHLSKRSEKDNENNHFFLDYWKEDFIINRKFFNASQAAKKWVKFRIGNFVEASVSLIKEYGVILNVCEKEENEIEVEEQQQAALTGFITNEILTLKKLKKQSLKLNQNVLCQILDVDYEKGILDLLPVKNESNNNNNNCEKAKKLATEKNQVLECSVLLAKEQYQICCSGEGEEQVLLLVEAKKINEQNEQQNASQNDDEIEEEEDSNNKKNKSDSKSVFVRIMNCEALLQKHSQQDVNSLNKANYMPICELTSKNFEKTKFDAEKQQNDDQNNNNADEASKKSNNNNKKLLSKLKLGAIVEGKIKNVKATSYTVELQDSVIVARLHKNHVEEEQETQLKVNEVVKAKILFIKKDKHLAVDLTMLKRHMQLGEELFDESILLPTEVADFKAKCLGKTLSAVVKSVNTNSIHPLYVEFDHEHQAHVSCFSGISDFQQGLIAEEIHKLQHLQKHFRPGQRVQVTVQKLAEDSNNNNNNSSLRNIEVSLVKNVVALDVGVVRVGKVCGNNANKNNNKSSNNKKLRIQIDDDVFGQVDALEIADEWLPNPLSKFAKNDLVPFRILSQNASGDFEISLRESVLNRENWEKALSPQTGTTLNFKKMFGEQEQNGDLRSRVFKLGPGCLKVGMIVVGYVNECNSHGCYIRVANNLSVRGQLNELSDTHLANPQAHFYRNKLVAARIIKIREDGKIDVSLRESVLKFGYSLDVTKLKTGMTLKGIVSEHKKGNAIVQIQNCKYRGTLSQKDFEVPEGKDLHSYFEVMLPVGSEVTCKITKIQKEPSVAITLSTLKKHFAQGIEEEADKQLEQQKTDEDLEHITTLIESIKQISSQNSQQEKLANDIQIESQGKYQQKITEMEQEEDEQDEEEDEENEEQEYEDFNDSEDENDLLIKQAIKDQEKEEEDEEEADSDEILSDQSVVEDMDDEDGENQVNNKKKSSRQKELLKRKKEEEIRKAEQRLLNEDAPPENKDDYERLILKNPNSSFIWIKYMAFAMQNEGIENAREVAERAIKVINFRNETEKLNVWTALMNLEHNFGTEKQLIAIFQRATQLCKPKMVYFRLLDIYRKSEKYDLLVELSKNMLKKFKHSSKVWIQHMKNLSEIKIQLAKEGKSEADSATYDLKEVMKRSLQCLKKQKHIIILSNYARIMYVSGEQETGRTTFDAILSNYPKRTDIWGVFLDMETKYGTVQTCRNLYERCISMSFKPRKMKYFFKRYLQFELQFGSTDKAEIVKQKAQEYVQSVLSKEGGDDEAMDVEGDQQNGNEDDGDAMEEEEESQE